MARPVYPRPRGGTRGSTLYPSLQVGVYPRPRGGTAFPFRNVLLNEGLSPPTRGNRLKRVLLVDGVGSIPAHAGEPVTLGRRRVAPAVYPRPRGGTA